MQGTFKATQYNCAGDAPQDFPPGYSWTITVNGTDGTFVQDNFGLCTITQTGTVTCPNSVVLVHGTQPTACSPTNCAHAQADGGQGCGELPPDISWTYTSTSATTFTTVTPTDTPLTTCTSQGKQNPLTAYWTKQ